jgi:hypothetical protein
MSNVSFIPEPINRESLRQLKAQKDELERLSVIKRIVNSFYKDVINVAETTTDTHLKIVIITNNNKTSFDEMGYRKSMEGLKITGSIPLSRVHTNTNLFIPPHLAPVTRENIIKFEGITDFCTINMSAILESLKLLFPDCKIEHTVNRIIQGQDKKEHTVASIDESLLPYIVVKRTEDTILIDWS